MKTNNDCDILISDLHLTSEICRGKLVCQILEDIRSRADVRRLIIDGDLFHRNLTPKNFHKYFKKHPKHARAMHMIEEISGSIEVVSVPGNHDPDIDELCKAGLLPGHVAELGYEWKRNGHIYYARHGHEEDDSLNHPLAGVAQSVINLVLKLNGEDPKFSRQIDKFFTHKFRKKRAIRVPLESLAAAKIRNAKFVFWGHTHEAVDAAELDGVIGYGIGNVCEHPASYLEVWNDGIKRHSFE